MFVLAVAIYGVLYILPSFISVDQVETSQSVKVPTPVLVDAQ